MEENKTEQGYCYKYPRPAVTTESSSSRWWIPR